MIVVHRPNDISQIFSQHGSMDRLMQAIIVKFGLRINHLVVCLHDFQVH